MSDKPKVSFQPAQRLEIRYTGNIMGDLEHLPKLGTVIKNERKANPHMLLLDTGNFSGPNKPGPHKGKPHIEVMNHLKYDAAVPGRAETKNSADLRNMGRLANFPFLASNWRGIGEGNYYERRLLLKRGELSVAVLGLAWPEPPQDTEVIPPEQAIREALTDLDTDSTVIVVLSQLGYMADRALATNIHQTMIIMSGVSSPGFEQQTMMGSSLMVPVAPGPESLGALGIDLSGRVEIGKQNKP
ncbi:MAG: hypothetical protein Q4F00_08170 [bacterium]|nr:hypothetical protein [bacterium]